MTDYQMGYSARIAGVFLAQNPYNNLTTVAGVNRWKDWRQGWYDAATRMEG